MNEELVEVVWTLTSLEDTYGGQVLGDMAEKAREAFLESLSPHEKKIYDFMARPDVGWVNVYDVGKAIDGHPDPIRVFLKRLAAVHLVKTRTEILPVRSSGRKRIEYNMPGPL